MKVYLVGGAVRDSLLQYPIKERDWVVVGATPDELLEQGYQQVGRSFPVFLHPLTREEYALARTERKHGSGYHGFECYFDPSVTLEDDLARRDLTINAMAMDDEGRVIDPYQGVSDLEHKVLRHVSPAFVEDPVRVLRVARFAARYHHLGFTLANETRELMYAMVKKGELNHLVAERIWQEWHKSLQEKNPEVFITTLRDCGALAIILPELNALFGVPNWRRYHPEVDSGVHTLMVVQAATRLSESPRVRFAAWMHDLGKATTPSSIWPSQRGHEKRGLAIITNLCKRLRIPTEYRAFALMVCRFHLNIHRFYELRANTIVSILEQVDAFRRPELFHQLLIVCEADGLGIKNPSEYKQAKAWQHVWEECRQINATAFVNAGYTGADIKRQLHEKRVLHVKQLLEDLSERRK